MKKRMSREKEEKPLYPLLARLEWTNGERRKTGRSEKEKRREKMLSPIRNRFPEQRGKKEKRGRGGRASLLRGKRGERKNFLSYYFVNLTSSRLEGRGGKKEGGKKGRGGHHILSLRC